MLKLGQSGSFSKIISSEDIISFSEIVGDTNPIHLDVMAAKNMGFDKRIAHGMLTGSLISAVLGTVFPGMGTIYLEQNLKFLKPVYEGEKCTAIVTVSEILKPQKGIYRFNTEVRNELNEIVIDGYAIAKYSEQ